jgi:hypothetical protein
MVERSHAGMHGVGTLRRGTEKSRWAADFCLFLAAAVEVSRCLIQRAHPRCRWPARPITRRLK